MTTQPKITIDTAPNLKVASKLYRMAHNQDLSWVIAQRVEEAFVQGGQWQTRMVTSKESEDTREIVALKLRQLARKGYTLREVRKELLELAERVARGELEEVRCEQV